MKRLLPIWILNLLILFFTYSCREESKLIETHKSVSIIEARKNDLNFREFNRLTSKNSLDVKADLKSIFQKSTSKINFDGFRIDTTFIKKTISSSNKTTFSLRAFKKGENPRNHIYNIVYHLEGNEWVAELVKFSFREEWLATYQQDSKIPFWGKAEYLGSEKLNSTTSKSGCELSIESLCYCADHQPGNCMGCSLGFRNVLIIDCSQSGGGTNNNTDFDWMNTPLPPGLFSPPYRDAALGGGGTTGTEFGNNPASLEDQLFKEEVWTYDLRQSIGSMLSENSFTYMHLEDYHIATKGQNIAFIGSLVSKYADDKDFLDWASIFLLEHFDTVTPLQFQNWFLGNGEGSDGGDIFDLNDYTNVQVQTYSSLPSRNVFYNAFPKDGTAGMKNTDVYQLVGGNLYNLHLTYPNKYWNACAIRVSRALNYSNYPIPVFKNKYGEQRTEKGSDGKNYLIGATDVLAYMLKAYPSNPPLHLTNKTPEQFLNALKGKWGIYIMIPKPGSGFTASGHADFFSYSGCLSGCYFQSAKEIYFWELN